MKLLTERSKNLIRSAITEAALAAGVPDQALTTSPFSGIFQLLFQLVEGLLSNPALISTLLPLILALIGGGGKPVMRQLPMDVEGLRAYLVEQIDGILNGRFAWFLSDDQKAALTAQKQLYLTNAPAVQALLQILKEPKP